MAKKKELPIQMDNESKLLFTEELLREICPGINSMCKCAESKFFNGHTNISDDKFVCFGVKGLQDSNKKLKDVKYRYWKNPFRSIDEMKQGEHKSFRLMELYLKM